MTNDPLPAHACQVPGVDPRPTLPPAPLDAAGQADGQRGGGEAAAMPSVPGEPGKGKEGACLLLGAFVHRSAAFLSSSGEAKLPCLIAANVELDPIYPDGPNLPSTEAPAVFQEYAQRSCYLQTLLLHPSQQIHSFLPACPKSQRNGGKVETGRKRWGFHLSRGLLSPPVLETRI